VEIGELVAPPAVAKSEPEGALEIVVVAEHDQSPIEGVDVSLGRRVMQTGSDGVARFEPVAAGAAGVDARKRFGDLTYHTFLTHYPSVTIGHDAESKAGGVTDVPSGGTGRIQVVLAVYRLLDTVTLERLDIDLNGDDKFGHWWTVIDGVDSYGWWPKTPLGVSPPHPPSPPAPGIRGAIQGMFDSLVFAARSANAAVTPFGRTLRGVEGELNGCTLFGGQAKRYGHPVNLDPHRMKGDVGDKRWQPVIAGASVSDDLKVGMHEFAKEYSGQWSWRAEFGQNCHSFQIAMMKRASLRMYKKI
jgi:hypothetical protein